MKYEFLRALNETRENYEKFRKKSALGPPPGVRRDFFRLKFLIIFPGVEFTAREKHISFLFRV